MSRRRTRAGALALLAALACAGEPPPPPPGEELPNLLLISLDTLRADRLGAYGHDRETSPFLDRLAAEGSRFARFFVNTHGTPPSHATMLSALYQETHRVSFAVSADAGWGAHKVPAAVPLVQELLRERGYRTLAVTDGGFMSRGFGFARGFDRFDENGEGLASGKDRLLALLRRHRGGERPVFAFLHTYEIHSPYAPPPELRTLFGPLVSDFEPTSENLRAIQNQAGRLSPGELRDVAALYDAGVRHADDLLAELFAELAVLGFLDRCLVLVTSDHGEELGEHGGLLHRATLFEELLRVPLILWGEGVPRGRVERRLASSIDLAPTLLAAAGVAVPAAMEGRDLLAAGGRRRGDGERVFAQYGDLLYALRGPRFKLIEWPPEGRAALFDLRQDPGEQNDVAGLYPGRAARMQAELAAWRAARPRLEALAAGEVEVDPEHAERLRALGYGH